MPPQSRSHPTLEQVQQQLCQFFSVLSKALDKKSSVYSTLANTPPIGRDERINIYRYGYYSRLTEAIAESFDTVKCALNQQTGNEKSFETLAWEFVRTYGSSKPNLEEIVDPFPEFIASHALAKKYPWLPDLAKLEWNVREVFYSRETPLLEPDALNKISMEDWPKVTLGLDPAVRFQKTSWPVYSLWEQRESDTLALPRDSEPEFLLFFRNPLDIVFVSPVEREAYQVLQLLMSGISLEDLCNKLEALPSPPPIGEWLQTWIQDGIIRSLHCG